MHIVVKEGGLEKVEVTLHPSFSKNLVVGNTTFRSTCDFHLTEDDLEIARKELGETDEVSNNCLKKLREMLSKDKNMEYRTDDDFLMRFLRYRKFNIKKTYKHIRRFYTMRNDNPELFTIPKDLEPIMKGKVASIMPYLDEDGTLVFLHKYGHWNPSEINVRGLLNMFSFVSDVISMNPHAQINGVMDIWDFEGTSVTQFAALVNPSTLRLWTRFFQDLYPYKLNRVIVYNCHSLVYKGWAIIRYFLKKKIADRIVFVQSGVEELHKYVNPAILPKEYGGCLEDDECYSYLKKPILSNKPYLEYEHSFVGYRK